METFTNFKVPGIKP